MAFEQVRLYNLEAIEERGGIRSLHLNNLVNIMYILFKIIKMTLTPHLQLFDYRIVKLLLNNINYCNDIK